MSSIEECVHETDIANNFTIPSKIGKILLLLLLFCGIKEIIKKKLKLNLNVCKILTMFQIILIIN